MSGQSYWLVMAALATGTAGGVGAETAYNRLNPMTEQPAQALTQLQTEVAGLRQEIGRQQAVMAEQTNALRSIGQAVAQANVERMTEKTQHDRLVAQSHEDNQSTIKQLQRVLGR